MEVVSSRVDWKVDGRCDENTGGKDDVDVGAMT